MVHREVEQSDAVVRSNMVLRHVVSLGYGASWVCYFRALQLGDASKVAPVDKFSVVLVALFSAVFLGERPALREWLAIGLIAGGVLLLALKP